MADPARRGRSGSGRTRRRRGPLRRVRRALRRLSWRRLSTFRRGLALGALGVAAVVAVLAVLSGLTLVRAAGELRQARRHLEAVLEGARGLDDAGARTAAIRRVRSAESAAARAEASLGDDPGLRLARVLPLVGRQGRAVVAVAADLRTAAGAGEAVLVAADALASSRQGGVVDIAAVRAVEQAARRGAADLRGARRGSGGLWGPLAPARRELDEAVADLADRLVVGADVAGVVRTMLGGDGPRHFFVAAQNNAEMRAQGMVLGYSTLRADSGRIEVGRFGHTPELPVPATPVRSVPEGMNAVFGPLDPARSWFNLNATADFAWSGATMAELYRAATGSPVDGVIAVDVPGLARVLRATGPVRVPGVEAPVTAANAAPYLLDRQYRGLPRGGAQRQRRDAMAELAHAVVQEVASGSTDLVELAVALADAAAGGHLRVWSADAGQEAVLERHGLGGGPAAGGRVNPLHVSVQNATATKLDYFIRPRVTVRVSLARTGTAVITTEVAVANRAPVPTPAGYQFGPDGTTTLPGEYLSRIYLWGPPGASQLGGIVESGMVLSSDVARVLPGNASSVRFTTVLRDAVKDKRLELTLVPQARANPADLRVILDAPEWHVAGPVEVRRRWTTDAVLTWGVTPL